MNIDTDVKLDYSDVLLTPQRSSLTSRSEVDLEVDFFEEKIIPIIAANMDGVGTFEMAAVLGKYKILTALTKHYSVDQLGDFYTDPSNVDFAKYAIYSMGISKQDYKKFVEFNDDMDHAEHGGLVVNYPLAVCVDVANGYTSAFEDFLTKFSETYPHYVLIAGNVVTPKQTEQLIECGVDIVKVGLGSGSVCLTRKLTGVGYPQLSAVLECSEAARDAGGKIIADGGITCPGDAAKAYAAGADLVMLGGYLAGHTEGMIPRYHEKGPVKFYGMASKEAQHIHNGGVADYRASEGKEVNIEFKGPVENTVKELLGGIRSSCTYIGAEGIDQMHRKAKFIRVNRQLNEIYR